MRIRIKRHGQLKDFDLHINPLVLYPFVLHCVVECITYATKLVIM